MSATFDPAAVRRALTPMWAEPTVVEQTGSTNADLVAAAASGAPEGIVLVAEWQTAGRGRLDRVWDTPAGTALTFSFIVRPPVPLARAGWLPMLAGLAVYDALRVRGADVHLKWPNDVQLGPERRKCGGILVQMATAQPPAFVVGIGLNVLTHDGLPETAAAIDTEWPSVSREQLLPGVLNSFSDYYAAWRGADGDADASGVLAAYRSACTTIGQPVRVFLPGQDEPVLGTALDVDTEGRLMVDTGDREPLIVGAGDVVHVRPAGSAP